VRGLWSAVVGLYIRSDMGEVSGDRVRAEISRMTAASVGLRHCKTLAVVGKRGSVGMGATSWNTEGLSIGQIGGVHPAFQAETRTSPLKWRGKEWAPALRNVAIKSKSAQISLTPIIGTRGPFTRVPYDD
jgi:hypothetical protein